MKKISLRKGFTLIELLIVITIIGILAVALLPNIMDAPAKARDATRKAHASAIVSAIVAYNADEGKYPPGGCLTEANDDMDVLKPYLPGGGFPADPVSDKALDVGGVDCAGAYVFCLIEGDSQEFAIVTAVDRVEVTNAYGEMDDFADCEDGGGADIMLEAPDADDPDSAVYAVFG